MNHNYTDPLGYKHAPSLDKILKQQNRFPGKNHLCSAYTGGFIHRPPGVHAASDPGKRYRAGFARGLEQANVAPEPPSNSRTKLYGRVLERTGHTRSSPKNLYASSRVNKCQYLQPYIAKGCFVLALVILFALTVWGSHELAKPRDLQASVSIGNGSLLSRTQTQTRSTINQNTQWLTLVPI